MKTAKNLESYDQYLEELYDNETSDAGQDFPLRRTCKSCGKVLLDLEFPPGRPGGKRRPVCNNCQAKRNSASYAKNAEARRASNRLRYHNRYSSQARQRESRRPDDLTG